MPQVGETGDEVAFVRWLKSEGDAVREGEPLFELDTSKAVVEVEAFAAGTLARLRAEPGDLVRPHQVVAVLLGAGEELPDESIGYQPAQVVVNPPEGHIATVAKPIERGRATPKAKQLASERGIELSQISGTGPGGLVTERDIDAAGGAHDAPTTPRTDRVRKAVAESTLTSWRTIPHFYLTLEADLSQGLTQSKPMALLVAAVARTLGMHPELNLTWEGDQLRRRESIDIGVLVDTPRGLLLPRVRNADRMNLPAVQEAITAAADRARAGQLRPDDYGPRSISISNLGMYSVDRFSGVIAAPDVMLLAVGRVRTVPRLESDSWRPRQVSDLTLCVDHRAIDGAAGGQFLATLEASLAKPEDLT